MIAVCLTKSLSVISPSASRSCSIVSLCSAASKLAFSFSAATDPMSSLAASTAATAAIPANTADATGAAATAATAETAAAPAATAADFIALPSYCGMSQEGKAALARSAPAFTVPSAMSSCTAPDPFVGAWQKAQSRPGPSLLRGCRWTCGGSCVISGGAAAADSAANGSVCAKACDDFDVNALSALLLASSCCCICWMVCCICSCVSPSGGTSGGTTLGKTPVGATCAFVLSSSGASIAGIEATSSSDSTAAV
mmetsp:Transcript_39562/g.58243  ORF Transcript_39562/g.58243 Transcript_39562/m.58243 type:complete len:254 (-) Transcript_39562:57-818(-)